MDVSGKYNGNAGTSNLTATVAPNTGEARTGNIVLKSKAGATTYTIPITQAGATGNITATPSTIAAGYVHIPATVAVTSVGNWSVSAHDTWISPSQLNGPNGTTNVTLTIADNTTDAPRTGTITFHNGLTGQTAVVTVNQGGKPTSITVVPARVTGAKAGGGQIVPMVAVSENNWTMGSAPSWVSVTPTSGESEQTAIGIKYDTPNNTGVKRSGYLRLKNVTTNEIAIAIIEQEG